METYLYRPNAVVDFAAEKTAADIMTPRVVSILATATVAEAAALLTEKNVSALPVVDESGKPIGVLSRGDIVAHDPKTRAHLRPGQEYYEPHNFIRRLRDTSFSFFHVQKGHVTRVRDIMSPVIFSVARSTPIGTVVDAMLALMVHRLFVTDDDGEVVGVISSMDVLRHLHRSSRDAYPPTKRNCCAPLAPWNPGTCV
jgi:CBS-domain-containing membrane protein